MTQALAQELQLPWDNGSQSIQGLPNFQFASLGDLIGTAMPYVFAAAGLGLLLMLISAGFTFLTSAGDAKKLESGKGRLTAALTGFIVIFIAYWLVQILGTVFGIEGIKETFK